MFRLMLVKSLHLFHNGKSGLIYNLFYIVNVLREEKTLKPRIIFAHKFLETDRAKMQIRRLFEQEKMNKKHQTKKNCK